MSKKNKIKLECYCADCIEYKKFNNVCILTSSLKFFPYDYKFSEEKMKQLIEVLLRGEQRLKITIEKVDE